MNRPMQALLALVVLLVAAPVAAAAPTVVSLTFDDATADHALAGQMLTERGLVGTFYVNSGRIGAAGYLSEAQLHGLAAAGHEIAGHTVTHANLAAIDLDEARREICNDRVTLIDMGFAPTSFAYPFSAYNTDVASAVAACGYASARIVGGLAVGTECSGCPNANPQPPTDAFGVKSPGSVRDGATAAQLQAIVRDAASAGGGWVPFVIHSICDGCSPFSVRQAELAAFLDWLSAQPDVEVQTVHRAMGSPESAPGVAGPPPEPTTRDNLLRNPSLETDADGNGLADCWTRSSFGTSTASWARVPGRESAWAEQVTVTALSGSANRKLVSKQDLGACAPPALAGHAYAATGWHRSAGVVRMVAYYRRANGSWVWWAQSPVFATGADWRLATWTTPPAPAEARAISITFSLSSTGSMAVDDLTLTDADTTAPAVTLTTPADGAIVSGTVPVQAQASDAGGLARVEFLVNGEIIATDAAAPFAADWDTTTGGDGGIGVTARAIDTAGNETLSGTHLVTVRNIPVLDTQAPTAALTAPAGPVEPGTMLRLAADAGDDVAVAHVAFLADGALVGIDESAPYAVDWDLVQHPNGAVALEARAVDTSGNATTSPAVQASLAVPPTSSVRCAGEACAGWYRAGTQVTFGAEDADGIAGTSYTIDGSDPGIGAGSAYDVPLSPSGSLTVRYRAWDADGIFEEIRQQPLLVDAFAPQLGASCGGGSCPTGPASPQLVSLTGSDGESGVTLIRYTLDGSQPTETAGLIYAGPFTVTSSATVRARAFDAVGNASALVTLPLQVDVTPPAVAITAPVAGATISGRFKILASASDASGVERVRFYADGVFLGSRTSGGWYRYWETTTVPNGTHTIHAVATDVAGLNSTSTTVTVTVANP